MIAGQRDFAEVIFYRVLISDVPFRKRGQADDSVHRGSDIMGHSGKEISLGLVGRFRLPGHLLQPLIGIIHINDIQDKQDKQPQRDHADQKPVFSIVLQAAFRNITQQNPALGGRDRRICDHALSAPGIYHPDRSCMSDHILLHLSGFCTADSVIGAVEFEEITVFERFPANDIVPAAVDCGKFCFIENTLRENPGAFDVGQRNDPHQDCYSFLTTVSIIDSDLIHKSQ